MTPEEEMEPYMDLLMDIAEVMIRTKEAMEKENARNSNGGDSSPEVIGSESTQDRQIPIQEAM